MILKNIQLLIEQIETKKPSKLKYMLKNGVIPSAIFGAGAGAVVGGGTYLANKYLGTSRFDPLTAGLNVGAATAVVNMPNHMMQAHQEYKDKYGK